MAKLFHDSDLFSVHLRRKPGAKLTARRIFRTLLTFYLIFMPGNKAMQVFTPEIRESEVRVDREAIHRLLGEQEGPEDPFSKAIVDQCIQKCIAVSDPLAAYVYVSAETPPSGELIAAGELLFQTGKIVHNMLKKSESYAAFIVTAGPGPEQLARELLEKGEYLEGYIVDLVASALVDSVADVLHEGIRKEAGTRDLKVSNRYSPGYCSWDVAEQQKLFSLFPAGCCGITLSESSLMDPVKSISGLIGIGARVKFNDYTCEICPMKECAFRPARKL
jgi:hypothetical protein